MQERTGTYSAAGGCVGCATRKTLSTLQPVAAVLHITLQPAALWLVLGCRWCWLPHRLRGLCCRAGGLRCRGAAHDSFT